MTGLGEKTQKNQSTFSAKKTKEAAFFGFFATIHPYPASL